MKATYFQNDTKNPIVYGEVNIKNLKSKRLKGEQLKEGVLAKTVLVGFCGTDNELMKMGRRLELDEKFPEEDNFLVNGHEGVVWVPEQNRFAIVLIRGGDSYDPTRYTEDESYFEYGCDKAHGLFIDENYYNPDMLLPIPDKYVKDGKIALSFAKKMVFPDPFACMLFQLERMEDLGSAHNFRRLMKKYNIEENQARAIAKDELFNTTVIFGLGTTGVFMGDLIKKNHPNAHIVFVARSDENSEKVQYALKVTGGSYVKSNYSSKEELANAIISSAGGRASVFVGAGGSEIEHEIAFQYKVLGCNGIYNSFSLGPNLNVNTMPFGFENQLIFGSINFRQDHMEKAIEMLETTDYNTLVSLIDKNEFIQDPLYAYENKIYSKNSPLKTAVIWDDSYIDWSL